MKILVIHASAGAGHKKAAEAIFNGLQAKGAGFEARLADALDYTNPFFKKSYPGVYAFLVTKLPWLWGFFFGLLDINWLQPAVRCLRRCYNGLNAGALHRFLIAEKFDAVITTQFLSAEVAAHLKRSGQIASKVVCVVTDYAVHHVWVNEGIDLYCAGLDHTKNRLMALGVAPEKICTSGIPVDLKFVQAQDAKALKMKLGLQDGPMTVLVVTGSFGMGPIESLMDLLVKYQVIIVCGHNQNLYAKLKPRSDAKTHVLGLVHNMDELMSVADVMVTKAGGLSLAEALVKKLPMIFFSAIPGQETGNIEILKSYHVAQGQSSLPQIAEIIRAWQAHPEHLDAVRRRMAELARPLAVEDIIALL